MPTTGPKEASTRSFAKDAPQDASRVPELSSCQHGIIGGLVGSLEQAMMRPSVFWKAQMQQQRFVFSEAINPRYCYRGLPVAVASIAPVTAVQFASANMCSNALRRARGGRDSLTDTDRFVSSSFAGMASAMVQSPFQLVEVNQQNSGGTIAACARRVLAEHGIRGMYRGGSMTIFREGFFCSSYMSMAPLFKARLLERHPGLSDSAATMASALVSGTIGATLSHPADTLKTRLQGSLFQERKPSGPREALQELRASGPLMPQVFRGYVPRVFRIVCCTYIYANLTCFFEGVARDLMAKGGALELGLVEGAAAH
mmetsp:Transcript_93588/g.261845  ORF Transcript_93588/g.261845 Transcript_93588/m.261845 type:complete len:314 (-) Transcript_93588:262-1203(-)